MGLKVYYKNAGTDPKGQCYLTSNYYLENALKTSGMLINSPDEADIIYIQENIGGLELFKKYPDKIKVLQMVCSHPDFYCDIYYKELEKFKMMDVRPRNWAPIRKEEIELADHILVYSNFTKKTCVDAGVPKEKIVVIPKGVEINFFKPNKREKNKEFIVGYAGQFQLIKGVQYLPIPNNDEEFKLIMCGDKTQYLDEQGKRSWQLKELFNLFGNTFTDVGKLNKQQMVDFYNKCDVIVVPSLEDSFAMTVLEALSCDVPVITTTNTGASELLTHHKNGSITPIKDPEAILTEIEYWMSHKAKDCRKTAMKHSMNKYMVDILNALRKFYFKTESISVDKFIDCITENTGDKIKEDLKKIYQESSKHKR